VHFRQIDFNALAAGLADLEWLKSKNNGSGTKGQSLFITLPFGSTHQILSTMACISQLSEFIF